MKKYAVLDDNSIVSNIIVCSSLEDAESLTSCYCVLLPIDAFVEIGYLYSEGSFAPLVETTPETIEDPGPPLIPRAE
jgi:hypothetical protein